MAEWTLQERQTAHYQLCDPLRFSQDGSVCYTDAIDILCQRNRALAALKLERTRLSKTVAYQNGYMEAENAMDDLGAAIAACTEAK